MNDRICRLCAIVKRPFDLVPMAFNFWNMVETICKIKIDLSDNNKLPRKVCKTCIDVIQKIEEFSKNINSSQAALHELFNSTESRDRSNSPFIESIDLTSEDENEHFQNPPSPVTAIRHRNRKQTVAINTGSKKPSLKKLSWTSVKSQCFGCSKKTIGILSIKRHINECNKIKKNGCSIVCGICRKKFISCSNYKTHVTRHAPHLKKMYNILYKFTHNYQIILLN